VNSPDHKHACIRLDFPCNLSHQAPVASVDLARFQRCNAPRFVSNPAKVQTVELRSKLAMEGGVTVPPRSSPISFLNLSCAWALVQIIDTHTAAHSIRVNDNDAPRIEACCAQAGAQVYR
jgi:hypothetical protein